MGRPALENLLMKELGLTYGGARKLVLEGRTSLGLSKFSEWTDELADECRRLNGNSVKEEEAATGGAKASTKATPVAQNKPEQAPPPKKSFPPAFSKTNGLAQTPSSAAPSWAKKTQAAPPPFAKQQTKEPGPQVSNDAAALGDNSTTSNHKAPTEAPPPQEQPAALEKETVAEPTPVPVSTDKGKEEDAVSPEAELPKEDKQTERVLGKETECNDNKTAPKEETTAAEQTKTVQNADTAQNEDEATQPAEKEQDKMNGKGTPPDANTAEPTNGGDEVIEEEVVEEEVVEEEETILGDSTYSIEYVEEDVTEVEEVSVSEVEIEEEIIEEEIVEEEIAQLEEIIEEDEEVEEEEEVEATKAVDEENVDEPTTDAKATTEMPVAEKVNDEIKTEVGKGEEASTEVEEVIAGAKPVVKETTETPGDEKVIDERETEVKESAESPVEEKVLDEKETEVKESAEMPLEEEVVDEHKTELKASAETPVEEEVNDEAKTGVAEGAEVPVEEKLIDEPKTEDKEGTEAPTEAFPVDEDASTAGKVMDSQSTNEPAKETPEVQGTVVKPSIEAEVQASSADKLANEAKDVQEAMVGPTMEASVEAASAEEEISSTTEEAPNPKMMSNPRQADVEEQDTGVKGEGKTDKEELEQEQSPVEADVATTKPSVVDAAADGETVSLRDVAPGREISLVASPSSDNGGDEPNQELVSAGEVTSNEGDRPPSSTSKESTKENKEGEHTPVDVQDEPELNPPPSSCTTVESKALSSPEGGEKQGQGGIVVAKTANVETKNGQDDTAVDNKPTKVQDRLPAQRAAPAPLETPEPKPQEDLASSTTVPAPGTTIAAVSARTPQTQAQPQPQPIPETTTKIVEKIVVVDGKRVRRKVRQVVRAPVENSESKPLQKDSSNIGQAPVHCTTVATATVVGARTPQTHVQPQPPEPTPETTTKIVEKIVIVDGKKVRRKVRQVCRQRADPPANTTAPVGETTATTAVAPSEVQNKKTLLPQSQIQPNPTIGFGSKEKIPGTSTVIVEEIVKVDGKNWRRKVRKVRRKRDPGQSLPQAT